MKEVEFIGGPWDGRRRKLPDPPDWVWLEGNPEVVRSPSIYQKPAAGRLPYRVVVSAAPGNHPMSYLYAGHTHPPCPSCRVPHALHDSAGRRIVYCTLCKGPLAQAHDVC